MIVTSKAAQTRSAAHDSVLRDGLLTNEMKSISLVGHA